MRSFGGDRCSAHLLDDMQSHIDARRNSRRGDDAIVHETELTLDRNVSLARVADFLQKIQRSPMSGCPPAIKQPGFSKQQRTRTNACHFLGCCCRRAYPIERFPIPQESAGAVAAGDDQEIDRRCCLEAVARRQLQIASGRDGLPVSRHRKDSKGGARA